LWQSSGLASGRFRGHIYWMNKAVGWLLAIWMMGFPIAVVVLFLGDRLDWFDRHPILRAGMLICWLGPLLVFHWREIRQRKAMFR
jgi:MFS family permease